MLRRMMPAVVKHSVAVFPVRDLEPDCDSNQGRPVDPDCRVDGTQGSDPQ